MALKITYVLFPKNYRRKNLETFLLEEYLQSINPIDGIPNLSPNRNTWVYFEHEGKKNQTTLLSFLSNDDVTGWKGFKKLEEWVAKVGVRDYPNTAKQKLKEILEYYNRCYHCNHKRKRDSVSKEPNKKDKLPKKLPTPPLKIKIPSKIKIDEKFLRDVENINDIVTEINEKRCETYLTDKRFEELTNKFGKKKIVSILETHIGLK